jgi:hypothetical protein
MPGEFQTQNGRYAVSAWCLEVGSRTLFPNVACGRPCLKIWEQESQEGRSKRRFVSFTRGMM